MSKCRDEFYRWLASADEHAALSTAWQAAWNAAMDRAAEICRRRVRGPDPVYLHYGTYNAAMKSCAEAIEKEKA